MNAATATRPAPRTSGIADVQTPAVHLVRWLPAAAPFTRAEISSGSDGDRSYDVSLSTWSCQCKGWTYRGQCRHLECLLHAADAAKAAYAARPLCPVCRINYLAGMTTCSAECDAILAAESLVEMTPAPIAPATCIGYGHLHAAAPGSNVQMYWCPVCDREATPKAAAIIAASATGASFGRQERQKDAWL